MIETSERVCPGYLAAAIWAIMPPIEAPIMWARSMPSAPSRAHRTAAGSPVASDQTVRAPVALDAAATSSRAR